MDAGAARAALTFMLAADTPPVVGPAAMDLLMQGAARQDMYGRYPSDLAWLPTYDLHSAATVTGSKQRHAAVTPLTGRLTPRCWTESAPTA